MVAIQCILERSLVAALSAAWLACEDCTSHKRPFRSKASSDIFFKVHFFTLILLCISMLLVKLLLLVAPVVVGFTIPSPLSLSTTVLDDSPSNVTSLRASRHWDCFEPNPALEETTYYDCHQIGLGLLSLDPTGRKEFLFSPRSVADIRLPFYTREGSCVLDIRGRAEDGWDTFKMSLLVVAIIDLSAK